MTVTLPHRYNFATVASPKRRTFAALSASIAAYLRCPTKATLIPVIRKFQADVLENRKLTAPGHYVLTFSAPELARDARPGHFVGVSGETGTQILRRPFSVYTADAAMGIVSILFSVYGPVTHVMAGYGPGDKLDLIGPLGGSIFTADPREDTHHIMVGGGYGVPPLAFLARTIRAANPDAHVTMINGARRADFLVGTDGLTELGVDVQTCTVDGSCGTPGIVTDLLGTILRDRASHIPVHVYTCGPTPMMRAVGEMAIAHDVACQVSMETFMPCGVGICMGCAVRKPDGSYVRGCTEGPVFEAREIVWE